LPKVAPRLDYFAQLIAQSRRLKAIYALCRKLDLDIHACGQVGFISASTSAGRLQNIEQTLVGANLDCSRYFLSTCGERSTQYLFFMWAKDRARDFARRAPRRVDNLTRGLVQDR